MSDSIDLEEVEKKAWRSTFEDGLLDIYFGILHLNLGIGIIFNDILSESLSIIILLTIMGLGLLFFLLGKKFISQPRLGRAKFGRKRTTRKLKTIAILTVNFLIILIIFLVGVLNPNFKSKLPGYLNGLFMGLLFVTFPLSFVAYILQFNRLYIIAILIGISFFLDELFALLLVPEPFDSVLAFGITSVIILSMGIFVFIRFLRKYPLTREEMVKK
ncbi:MAG: hypothetical protein ACFFCI_17725 [Promethearchaeota archaeon]